MQWKEFRSHVQYLPEEDLTRIQKAFELGKKMHGTQQRKSGEPYFTHPIAVAHLLADWGADGDTIIAALLHDTVEDTSLTLEDIRQDFGPAAVMLIDGVTKLSEEDLVEKPTLNKQIETLRKIFSLMQSDIRIMVIKLADRLHNMQTIEFLSEEKRKVMAQETIDVYVKIAARLSMSDVEDELESLCLSILDPENFRKLLELRKKNERTGAKILHEMQQEIHTHHHINGNGVSILYERKRWAKLQRQMVNENLAITGFSTLSIVFVCPDIDACYRMMGTLHQIWKRETLSFEDYINDPMINGYKGIHTTIILSDGKRVRCKIRTHEMQEYAHKGITTYCFSLKERQISDYLPWTQHISPLASDTMNQSQDFWENLQSDILGEYIIIHGAGDQTTSLPRGSTALDGAFYLFGEKALALESIRINGQPTDFSRQLKHSDSLAITWSKKKNASREWLDWVQTGLATALIRKSLGNEPEKKKLITGKILLQEEMSRRKAGYIDEFDQAVLSASLRSIGYESLQDAYVAIADGHLEPVMVYKALFTYQKTPQVQGQSCIVQFSFDSEDINSLERIIQVYKKFNISFKDMKLRPLAMLQGVVQLRLSLTPEEQRTIISAFRSAGAKDVSVQPAKSRLKFYALIFLLLIIWGFDPAVAYLLIHRYSINSIDLSLVRFWSLTVMSAFLLFVAHLRKELPKTRLNLRKPYLWLSVILMVCIALTTYSSLQGTQPVYYSIPMTAGGLVLTTIVNRKRKLTLLFTWLLLAAGVSLLILFTPSWSLTSMLYTLLAVISFSVFSVVSEQYKLDENIAARAAQYFFVLSLFSSILSLPLIGLSHLWSLSPHIVLLMSLFSIIFAGLPYYLYYYLLSYRELDFVLRFSFLIIYSTLAGQLLLLPHTITNLAVTLVSALIVTIGALLPLIQPEKK